MNNIKNKIWWGIILIIVMIVVGGLISKSSNKVASEEKVRVAYLPGVQALPLYLALNKGYFKEAGLNVEAVKFDAPNQIIDALLSGQADAAFAAAGGITAVAESKKPGSIKVILLNGATAGHEGDSILVKKDSTITSVGQLRGKKVGVLPGIQWRTIAQHVFSENGLSVPADITLVELAIPLQAQALASGQVDALLAIEPVITVVRSNGIGKDIMTSTANRFIADPFY
ncbi:transporter substrate-binding domain-containing protein, partial [Patescibacteria group bacterium]